MLEQTNDRTNGRAPKADAEQAVHQLQLTQRLTRTGTWEWQIEADEVIWSDELYRIFGVDPDDFHPSYAAILRYVHPEDRASVHGQVQDTLRSGGLFEFEHRLIRPDGDVRSVHCNGEVVLDGDRAVYAFGTCQDVTERIRAEQEAGLARELVLAIGASETAAQALETVLNRICEATGLLLGQAWRLAPDAHYMEQCAAWPVDGELEPFRRRSESVTFEPGKGLPGVAFETHEPVWTTDMKAPDLPRASFARMAGVGAGLAVPVHAHHGLQQEAVGPEAVGPVAEGRGGGPERTHRVHVAEPRVLPRDAFRGRARRLGPQDQPREVEVEAVRRRVRAVVEAELALPAQVDDPAVLRGLDLGDVALVVVHRLEHVVEGRTQAVAPATPGADAGNALQLLVDGRGIEEGRVFGVGGQRPTAPEGLRGPW